MEWQRDDDLDREIRQNLEEEPPLGERGSDASGAEAYRPDSAYEGRMGREEDETGDVTSATRGRPAGGEPEEPGQSER